MKVFVQNFTNNILIYIHGSHATLHRWDNSEKTLRPHLGLLLFELRNAIFQKRCEIRRKCINNFWLGILWGTFHLISRKLVRSHVNEIKVKNYTCATWRAIGRWQPIQSTISWKPLDLTQWPMRKFLFETLLGTFLFINTKSVRHSVNKIYPERSYWQ